MNDNRNDINHKPHIPLKDSLFLSPIEKYKIYGRFPWKMLIHTMIVIVTTAQAVLIVSTMSQYTRAQERIFYNNFISDNDKTDVDYKRSTYLYSISQLKDHINNSIYNFYGFKDNSLELVEYNEDKDNIIMEVNYIGNKISSYMGNITQLYQYKVNQTTLGPFDYSEDEVKLFINSVLEFRLNYTLKTFVPFYFGDHFECFSWKVNQIYSFMHRAHFDVKLIIQRVSCKDKTSLSLWEYFVNRLMWIHIIVIILATASLILTWKYVYKIAKLYWRVKSKLKKKKVLNEDGDHSPTGPDMGHREIGIPPKDKNEWSQVLAKDKSKFFNMWSVVCLVGNVVQIFSSGLSLFDTDNIMASTEILVGFGCMLAYVNIGRYLEYNRDYSTIFATIQRALPNVLRYLLGVMPIFFGFIFFGLCLFWRSERFTSTSSTMITLFSMINGDSIFDIFTDLTGVSFFLGQIYCYIFCIMFIVVVMNVFISIIEEAYVSTKMKNQNHWIYSYLKVDPNYVQIKDLEDHDKKLNEDANKSKENPNDKMFRASTFNDSLFRHDKEQRKIAEIVKSKNILKDVMDKEIEENKTKNISKLSKSEIEKVFETYFNNIGKSLEEIEKMSEEISGSHDTQLKDELRLFIFDHITSLESKVGNLRDLWMQQH